MDNYSYIVLAIIILVHAVTIYRLESRIEKLENKEEAI